MLPAYKGDEMTANQAQIPSGSPVAEPMYLVDENGLPMANTSGSSTSSVITSVNGSASSVLLLAANANRKNFSVYNDSSVNLYLACAASASTTAYTVKIPSQNLYESQLDYTGTVSGVWDSAVGAARVTEFS